MLAFVALVASVPSVDTVKRILGLVLGIPIIYLGNLFRIYFLTMVALKYGIELESFLHDYVWKGAMVLIVLASWIAWELLIVRSKAGFYRRIAMILVLYLAILLLFWFSMGYV